MTKLKEFFKKISHIVKDSLASPLLALLCNLAIAYLVYFACRIVFLLVNYSYFSDNLSAGHLMEMLGGGVMFDTSAIMYTLSLYIVLMLFPLHYKERPWYQKMCKWIFVVMNSLAVVMNLCDTVYFQYTSRRTTSTVFTEFQNENNLAGIFGTEIVRHWYLVLIAAALIFFMWKCYVKPRLHYKRLNWVKYDLTCLVSLLAMVGLMIGGMRGGFTTAVRPITISNANQYVDRPIEAALVLNTPFSMLRTIGKNVFDEPKYFASQQEMEAIFSPIHMPDSGAVMNKKNVVIIIIESYGKEYIGALNHRNIGPNYKGYAPFTDSLINRSLTFEYSFANGRKSIDAMPSVLSSIPMMREPFILTPASMNDLTGIAKMLAGKGYHTAFFHGAQNGSMGFEAFARATGYKEYYGRTEFNADPNFKGDDDFDGTWAIWDEPFLQFMEQHISTFKQPFVATVFTASSHHPYKVPEQYANEFKEEGGNPMHKCIRYTDLALRRFFEKASQEPWYQNTVFVIVANHTNRSTHSFYKTDQGLYSIPIIFFTPDGSLTPGIRPDAIAQQASIMPTLLHVVGYDQPYLSFGCDLLSTPPEQTWALNYNNGIYQYFKGEWMMQFDGERVKAMYRFRTDPMLCHNLVGQAPEQAQMEREVKSMIQQYMHRMNNNQLIYQP